MATPNLTIVPPVGSPIEDLPDVTIDDFDQVTHYTGDKAGIQEFAGFPDSIFPVAPKRVKDSYRDGAGRWHELKPAASPTEPTKHGYAAVRRIKGGRFHVHYIKTDAEADEWRQLERRKRAEARTEQQYASDLVRLVDAFVQGITDAVLTTSTDNPKGYYFKRDREAVARFQEGLAILQSSKVGVGRGRMEVVRD